MSNKFLDNVPILYESYFLRDLTYTLSGIISLFSVTIIVDGLSKTLLVIIGKNIELLLVSLGISYVFGLIIQELFCAIRIFKMKPEIPEPFSTRHVLLAKTKQKFGTLSIQEFERTVYLKHFGAGFGSSALLSTIFIIVSGFTRKPIFFIGLAFSIPLFLISLYINRDKYTEQNKALIEFSNQLGNK